MQLDDKPGFYGCVVNQQIEHHLFPSVCHLYYPRIQPIVKATCDEYNVPYTWFPTVSSHGQFQLKLHFTEAEVPLGYVVNLLVLSSNNA